MVYSAAASTYVLQVYRPINELLFVWLWIFSFICNGQCRWQCRLRSWQDAKATASVQWRVSAIWALNKKPLVNAAFIQNCCLQLFMGNLLLLSGRLQIPLGMGHAMLGLAQAISLEGWVASQVSQLTVPSELGKLTSGPVPFLLAVQNSLMVTLSLAPLVRWAPLTIRVFTALQSDPRDLWPLRHLIRVMRRQKRQWRI